MDRLVWIALIALVAAGCSNGDSGQESAVSTATPAESAAPPEETVFDPLVGTMDRAKTVDDVAAGRMDELNQQLEASE